MTFTVQLPQELASRAGTPTFGNGLSSQNLTAIAYFQGTATIADIKENVSFNGGLTTTVSFNLANGQDYDIVFWASDASCAYTLNNANATVTLDATKLAANVESQDAFFAKESLTTNGQRLNKTVKLYRPFAQLNLGTSDLASNAVAGNTTVTPNITGAYENGVYTTVSAKAYNSLNLLNNQMGTLTNVEFPAVLANPTDEEFPFQPATYKYLSMVYLLVDTKTAEDVTFNFYDGNAAGATAKHTLTVPNTPLQRNYQTNIYGALLTTTAEYNVEIVPGFKEPDYDEPQPSVTVSTLAQLNDAVASHTPTINVAANITLDKTLNLTTPTTLNIADGSTLTIPDGKAINAKNLAIQGGAIVMGGNDNVLNVTKGTLTVKGTDIRSTNNVADDYYFPINLVQSVSNFTDVNINVDGQGIGDVTIWGGSATFDNCVINGGAYDMYGDRIGAYAIDARSNANVTILSGQYYNGEVPYTDTDNFGGYTNAVANNGSGTFTITGGEFQCKSTYSNAWGTTPVLPLPAGYSWQQLHSTTNPNLNWQVVK